MDQVMAWMLRPYQNVHGSIPSHHRSEKKGVYFIQYSSVRKATSMTLPGKKLLVKYW